MSSASAALAISDGAALQRLPSPRWTPREASHSSSTTPPREENSRKIENLDVGAAKKSDAGDVSALEEFKFDLELRNFDLELRNFDIDLMKLNDKSFEPKSSMRRPWNPESQG